MKAMAVVLTIVLAVPAAAQDRPLSERTGVAPALGLTPSTEDFVRMIATGSLFNIEAGKLAQQKADEKSKAFAAKVITDYQRLSSDLAALVGSGRLKIELPSTLDSAHERQISKLQELTGESFDAQYDKDQLAAHKEVVSLLERYAKGGDHPDLKLFAAKALPRLEEVLRMARDLRK
jgi:putative membrane protein